MDQERWQRLQDLLAAVWPLGPGERVTYLDEHCRDPELRAKAQALLDADEKAAGYFERLAGDVGVTQDEASEPVDLSGRRVGNYELITPLGRGGMGVVYLAERADGTFEQQVAVKLLAMGVASPEGHRRFVAERQFLAGLEHPAIARLLDGGVTEDGTPYFVMEWVEGERIDTWCDARRLGVRERLELLCRVCEAVEYAHRNLIVHRDLKPANVLVTERGDPKLLDFGVAKLLTDIDPGLTRSRGAAPLTPASAAPEQVGGGPVTTATDTYALGVLAHVLLAGVPPHDFDDRSPTAILRQLESEPATPSRKLASLPEAEQVTIAEARGASVAELRRALTGDLDAVLRRALAPEPRRRYGSARELAADLGAHLEGRPVTARPPSLGYRAGRFVLRHRAAVAGAAVIVALLASLVTVSIRSALRVAAERDRAEEVTTFLVDLFEVSDPDRAQGRQITARELLDRGSERIRRELAVQPRTRATMLAALGRVYRRLGEPERAATHLEEALRLFRRRPEAWREEIAEAQFELGNARVIESRLDEAERLLRESLASAEELYGVDDLRVTPHRVSLGYVRTAQGEYAEAEELLTHALDIRRRQLGDLHPDVAASRIALGLTLHYTGRFDEVERLFEQAAETYRQRPDAVTTDYADALRMLAHVAIARRQYDKAEGYVQEGLEVFERLYGAEDYEMASMWAAAAELQERRGNLGEATDLAHRALAILRTPPQPRLADQADVLRLLARLLLAQGRAVEAEAVAREALGRARELDDPIRLATSHWMLGNALRDQDRYAEARQAYEEILGTLASRLPEGHSLIALTEMDYGILAGREGRWEEATSRLRRAVELYEPRASPNSAMLATVRLELARALAAGEQTVEALRVLDQSLPILISSFGEADERVRDGRALRAQVEPRRPPPPASD